MKDHTTHPDYSRSRSLARAFLDETTELLGPISSLMDLVKRARAVVTLDDVNPMVLTLAVAEVFSEYWESRNN